MQVLLEEIPGSDALSACCNQDDSERVYSKDLAAVIEVIAAYGKYWHDWSQLKTLLAFRLKQVLQKYYEDHVAVVGPPKPLVTGETFTELRARLLESLDTFDDGPPFTLQRLCEILAAPEATYPTLDKVALAFEKLLIVTSTLPVCSEPYPTSLPPLKRPEAKHVSVDHGYPLKNKDVIHNQVISAKYEPDEELPWPRRNLQMVLENGVLREMKDALDNQAQKTGSDEEMCDADLVSSTRMEVESVSTETCSDIYQDASDTAFSFSAENSATKESLTSDSVDVLMVEDNEPGQSTDDRSDTDPPSTD